MPGLGVRLWNPQYRTVGIENPLTVFNGYIADAVSLDGYTFPFHSYTGHFLVRMVGRANKATRPLNIQVRWNSTLLTEQSFFVESGAGGTFAGLWTMVGATPALGSIVITCGTGNAGCCAIRCGEISGKPTPVNGLAKAGYSFTRTMIGGHAMLVVGGCADATAFPLSSPDLDTQYGIQIPAKTDLPNRHDGLSAYFGLTYVNPTDSTYDIIPQLPIAGVIAALEIKL
jgi:hypothetical protein